MPFPDDFETKKEFARIKSCNPLIGDGERACMAVARLNENIVASSNFRDVAPYCTKFNVLFWGTLDILFPKRSNGNSILYSEIYYFYLIE
jgi:hypothetical protein